jgi:hypothetical protein
MSLHSSLVAPLGSASDLHAGLGGRKRPQWDLFGQVFAGMDHQYAPQSVWVRVDRSPDCPVCGSRPVSPLTRGAGDNLAGIVSQYRRDTISRTRLAGRSR